MIACRVSEGIVDELEAVEVDEYESDPLAVTQRTCNRLPHSVRKQPAVRQTREVIVIGESSQVLESGGELGEVPSKGSLPLAERDHLEPRRSELLSAVR